MVSKLSTTGFAVSLTIGEDLTTIGVDLTTTGSTFWAIDTVSTFLISTTCVTGSLVDGVPNPKIKTDKTTNSNGLPPEIYLLAFNNNGTPVNFSAHEVALVGIGGKITPTEQGLLYDIWVDGYLAAVGAKI